MFFFSLRAGSVFLCGTGRTQHGQTLWRSYFLIYLPQKRVIFCFGGFFGLFLVFTWHASIQCVYSTLCSCLPPSPPLYLFSILWCLVQGLLAAGPSCLALSLLAKIQHPHGIGPDVRVILNGKPCSYPPPLLFRPQSLFIYQLFSWSFSQTTEPRHDWSNLASSTLSFYHLLALLLADIYNSIPIFFYYYFF